MTRPKRKRRAPLPRTAILGTILLLGLIMAYGVFGPLTAGKKEVEESVKARKGARRTKQEKEQEKVCRWEHSRLMIPCGSIWGIMSRP
jgi:hypothetical protein